MAFGDWDRPRTGVNKLLPAHRRLEALAASASSDVLGKRLETPVQSVRDHLTAKEKCPCSPPRGKQKHFPLHSTHLASCTFPLCVQVAKPHGPPDRISHGIGSQSAQPAPLGKPALYKPGQITASFGAAAPGSSTTSVNTPPPMTATTPTGSATFDSTNPLASPIGLDLNGTAPQRPRIADSFSPANDQSAAAGSTPTASAASPQAGSTDAARALASAPTAPQALAAAPGFGASPGTDSAGPASPAEPAMATGATGAATAPNTSPSASNASQTNYEPSGAAVANGGRPGAAPKRNDDPLPPGTGVAQNAAGAEADAEGFRRRAAMQAAATQPFAAPASQTSQGVQRPNIAAMFA